MHGAHGYMMDSPIQRYFRDARMLTISEGSSEVQHINLARGLGLCADDYYVVGPAKLISRSPLNGRALRGERGRGKSVPRRAAGSRRAATKKGRCQAISETGLMT